MSGARAGDSPDTSDSLRILGRCKAACDKASTVSSSRHTFIVGVTSSPPGGHRSGRISYALICSGLDRVALAAATVCLASGCSTIGYYAQSATGHLDLLPFVRRVFRHRMTI